MVRWLKRGWTSIEGDVGSSPFALPPAEDTEAGEEQGAEQGEHELDVALRVLASVAELLVLLLDGVVVVARVELRPADVGVSEVGLAEELGARGDEVRVAAAGVALDFDPAMGEARSGNTLRYENRSASSSSLTLTASGGRSNIASQ